LKDIEENERETPDEDGYYPYMIEQNKKVAKKEKNGSQEIQ
jgi:hypothetical protein